MSNESNVRVQSQNSTKLPRKNVASTKGRPALVPGVYIDHNSRTTTPHVVQTPKARFARGHRSA